MKGHTEHDNSSPYSTAVFADFGVFVAIGVVCAFVVMGMLVPAALILRDRRSEQSRASTVRSLGLGGLMRGPTWLAVRIPAAGLTAATVLAILSLVAAQDLVVEFNRDQFIPKGSDVEAVLGLQNELFGASLNEATFVIIDGDFTDPAVVNAVWVAQRNLDGIDDVRTVDGNPQVRSAVTLAVTALRQNPLAKGIGWTDDGFAPDANMGAVYDMLRRAVGDQQVNQFLRADNRSGLVQVQTTAGDVGAKRLPTAIDQAFAPVEELGLTVVVTSEPIIMGEMSDDLSAFQARSIVLTLAVVLLVLTAYYWFSSAVVCFLISHTPRQ